MQQNRLMNKTAIYTVLFAVCALAVIFRFSLNKLIVIADTPQDEVAQDTRTQPAGRPSSQESAAFLPETVPEGDRISFVQTDQEMNYFCIPLPDSIRAEDVTVENRYMDKEIWVRLKEREGEDGYEDFYRTQGVYGKRDAVVDGYFEGSGDMFFLKFRLTDIYEHHSIFEDNKLYIDFAPPKEIYDRIVVIDPAYGAEETGAASGELQGKDVTLEIARALKKLLDETDIKVYYTRMDDSGPSEESRVELANTAKADLLIRIEVNEDKDSKVYGTEAVYNSSFFIPGFGSVELADLLEREVVTAISGKANGLVESEEKDVVINWATVPAATIKVGYVSNGQEAILLKREDYIQKIANGIYQAILKTYTE